MASAVPGAVPGAAAMLLHAAIADALRQARASRTARLRGAGRLYEGVLTMAPDHVEALHLLGLVHLQLGDPARAEPLIARSMKFGLSQPWNLANHAAALTGVGRHRDALALADRALVADPDHAPSHAARGDALLALGQYDAALTAYDRALVREPAATAWRKRGETLRWLERPADALISVERALRLDPSDAAANIERGHALRALGHRELALHSYQLAIVVRGKTPELVAACGVVLTELGRPADALACLDEAPHDSRTTSNCCTRVASRWICCTPATNC